MNLTPQITPEQVRSLKVSNGRLVEKANKYQVSPAADRTYGGVVFDSKREMVIAQTLDVQKAAGLIKRIDRQVKYPMVVNGKHICTLIVDFKVLYQDGSVEAIEVKGFPTPVWKLKWALFKALYPETVLKVVK